MNKVLKAIESLGIKILGVCSLLLLTIAVNFSFPQSGYAATQTNKAQLDVIQPFELTRPAATRQEAYEEIAELAKNPQDLIDAQNQEEKADEELVKAEENGEKTPAISLKK